MELVRAPRVSTRPRVPTWQPNQEGGHEKTIGLTLASAILLAVGLARRVPMPSCRSRRALMPRRRSVLRLRCAAAPAATVAAIFPARRRSVRTRASTIAAHRATAVAVAGAGVVIPGTGVGVGVGPGGAGVYVAPRRNCRTITVQRSDGSVTRTERCD